MCVIASPDYLAEHGMPRHPSELAHHECLSYNMVGAQQAWTFEVAGMPMNFPIRARLHANNGEALTEAAVQGLGIALQPAFIAEDAIMSGKVVTLLEDFTSPELGIYAMLPSNRQVPHRVRVLMDFLGEHLN